MASYPASCCWFYRTSYPLWLCLRLVAVSHSFVFFVAFPQFVVFVPFVAYPFVFFVFFVAISLCSSWLGSYGWRGCAGVEGSGQLPS